MATWPATLEAAIRERGRPDCLTPQMLYKYKRHRSQPRLGQLKKLARAMGVRPGFFLDGKRPMTSGSFEVVKRELWLVDGVWADFEEPDGDAASRAREAFFKGFGSDRKGNYQQFKPIVRLMFGDLLARVMNQYRSSDCGEVHDPTWRGEVAGLMLDYYFDLAREEDDRTRYDDMPWSTRTMMSAMVGDMEKWERIEPGDPKDEFRSPLQA